MLFVILDDNTVYNAVADDGDGLNLLKSALLVHILIVFCNYISDCDVLALVIFILTLFILWFDFLEFDGILSLLLLLLLLLF